VNLGKPEMRRYDLLQRAKENRRKNEALAKADEQYPLLHLVSNDIFLSPGA